MLQENQAYISNFEALIIALQLRSPSTNGPDVACDLFSKLTLSFTSLELYQSSYRMSVHTPPPPPPLPKNVTFLFHQIAEFIFCVKVFENGSNTSHDLFIVRHFDGPFWQQWYLSLQKTTWYKPVLSNSSTILVATSTFAIARYTSLSCAPWENIFGYVLLFLRLGLR